ncbi:MULTISPECIES: hypothetical protein [unclassified Burkholderia]|nr:MULTISPECIES: hypothetical protein [unclassified Burkholderia]
MIGGIADIPRAITDVDTTASTRADGGMGLAERKGQEFPSRDLYQGENS